MSTTLPPAIRREDFTRLETLPEKGVERAFGGTMQRLHAFLNDDPVTNDLLHDRKLWAPRAWKQPSFGSFGFQDRHWYTFNNGGRNEAQLNVGMFGGGDGHLRIGLGFERTERQGGRPQNVALIYTAFADLLAKKKDPVACAFIDFMYAEQLEIEVWREGSDLEIIPTDKALAFLVKPRDFAWLLVGKLLRPGKDEAILATPTLFATTLQRVFRGVRPLWRLSNERGRALL
jgi:hypothetical protein